MRGASGIFTAGTCCLLWRLVFAFFYAFARKIGVFICLMANKLMKNCLYLAGLGLCDETDLPLRTVEALKKCGRVFAENYTNFVREGTFSRLGRMIGKTVQILPREEVEGEKIILNACEEGCVALLVPGDPMSATTHNSLLASARKRGFDVKILHASSIFSAAPGACGLQNYKFGKTATITYWRENFEPTSFLDVISQNKKIGAHTLCLLDVDMKLGPMKPSQAIEILKKAQKKIVDGGMKEGEIGGEEEFGEKKSGIGENEGGLKKETARGGGKTSSGKGKEGSGPENEKTGDGQENSPVIDENAKIFVASKIGWKERKIWAGKLKEYRGQNENCPAIIIICGKMHFMEEEGWEHARD